MALTFLVLFMEVKQTVTEVAHSSAALNCVGKENNVIIVI
jgi:hypothetical protein